MAPKVYEVPVSPLICCFITFIFDRTKKQRCTTNVHPVFLI